MYKYSIEVTEAQAKLIALALDIYSRMEGGQLGWVFSMIPWKYYENLKDAEPLIKELQQLLTGMQNGSIGISNVSNEARIAFDLHRVIRNQLSWDENSNGKKDTRVKNSAQWSSEPLAKIGRLDNNSN